MTFAIDTIPSQQSTTIASAKPVTELSLVPEEFPCVATSIISKDSGEFLFTLKFSGEDCAAWEGYVCIPEEKVCVSIREAWEALEVIQRYSPASSSSTMVLDQLSTNPFPEVAIVEDIVRVAQSSSAASRRDETMSFQRELRIEYEGGWFYGCVFVPRDDVSTLEAIAQARKEFANDLDLQRETVTAVPSVEVKEEEAEEEEKRGELKTFSFKDYPRVGQLANVTAEDVHGFDLDDFEVSILAMRHEGTTRDVRFRCLLPGNRKCWYEGSLTGDLRLGRFVEIKEP